jgi:hypothetical protein
VQGPPARSGFEKNVKSERNVDKLDLAYHGTPIRRKRSVLVTSRRRAIKATGASNRQQYGGKEHYQTPRQFVVPAQAGIRARAAFAWIPTFPAVTDRFLQHNPDFIGRVIFAALRDKARG